MSLDGSNHTDPAVDDESDGASRALPANSMNHDFPFSRPKSSAADEATSEGALKHETDLQIELAGAHQRSRELAADFENFRKRTTRDSELRAGAQKNAFIRDLLPVVDNLERALSSSTGDADAGLVRGVEMTLRLLANLLQRHGVRVEESLGLRFDPTRHEALSARFDPHLADQIIIEVVERGYWRGDELLRPARVIINDHHVGPQRSYAR